MKRSIFILLHCSIALSSFGISIQKTIYLNRGIYTAVDNTQFPMFCFNEGVSFNSFNPILRIALNDTLVLKVINTDTVIHGFDIKQYSAVNSVINPGDSVQISFSSAQIGCFAYYDSYNDSDYAFSGASGMISVMPVGSTGFFWTIKDLQNNYNEDIASGSMVNWNNYYPNYFTINGKSNPDINNDTTARVTGNVGDTIYISIANTGKAAHSIHFHGYHSQIVFSSKFPDHAGRNKDTFPVYSMETIILRLIPDKPGEFPVHDHNLVAVTGGMIYPSGMFLTMLIQ